MGRGGKGIENDAISWAEVKNHTSMDDRWIVIDGEVYDVTNWSKKHPGGPRLIGHYAGQDATDAFGAFHNDLSNVRKYLKPIHIGSVSDYVDSDIDKDFRKVKGQAIKMGLFKPSYFFFFMTLGYIILLDVLAYFTLIWFEVHWWSVLLSVLLASTAQAQSGWLQHDFGHLSVFKDSRIDHFFHHLTVGFLKGASSSWWNSMHHQHHAKPNVIDKDPDVRVDKLFVVGEVMPVEVAKTRKKSMPFNHQHKYFFALGPPLLFPVYFQFMLFRHEITRKLWKELAITLTAMGVFLYFFLPLLGILGCIVYFFTTRCIDSHWFTWVSQSNHIPMIIKKDEANPWLKLQIYATCNVEKSFFNDWFTGHLNFQIEHQLLHPIVESVLIKCQAHEGIDKYWIGTWNPIKPCLSSAEILFPTMPRHNFYKIAPAVKSLCEKHNIPYIVKPLWQSFVDIVKSLKTSGELWTEVYKEFHGD